MDAVLAFAPEGCADALLSLCAPLVAAGAGLALLFWFLGGLWQIVMSIFEL